MIDIYTLSVIVFFAIIVLLIFRYRKTIEIRYLAVIKRTNRGRRTIDNLAKLSPKTWKILSTFGILVCFFIMFLGIFILIATAKGIIDKAIQIPALQFVLPIPAQQPIAGIGFIGVPFWFWIIVITFILFPHELSHGIISRVEKIKLKSVGLMLFLIFPGAFIEPDEKQLKKAKLLTKLRIFCAGSAANILIVLILANITSLIIWPAYVKPGLVITSVNETAPAGIVGLKENFVIQKIGNKELKPGFGLFSQVYGNVLIFAGNVSKETTSTASSSVLVASALKNYRPNDTIVIKANDNYYNLTLASHPLNSSLPYIGISTKLNTVPSSDFAFSIIFPLVWWCVTLGFAVALINILPIYPLDGGLVIESLTQKLSKRYYKKIVFVITAFTISLIVFSFIGPWLMELPLSF